MRITVASGKGGTGKTTLSTSLATMLAEQGGPVAYLDCDVEEPNGHIFLNPEIRDRIPVHIPVPEVDLSACLLGKGGACRACSQACRFSAILALKDRVLTFPKLCHGCGGCVLACPVDAIREVDRVIGHVETGTRDKLGFVHGLLDIGEAMAPPLIRAVLEAAPVGADLIIDAPPGTSCPVIASVSGADVVVLVTEPTPFGLNDLVLAVDMVRALGLPFGVAINRVGIGDDRVHDFCKKESIPVLMEIPDDRGIAEAYSRGELLATSRPDLLPALGAFADELGKMAQNPRPEPRIVSESSPVATEPLPLPSEGIPPGQAQTVRELVVVSGKGGTGKTSVVASFAALASQVTTADCDTDAADLHLVSDPEIRARWSFTGGFEASIDRDRCTFCKLCLDRCRFDALHVRDDGLRNWIEVDRIACEGCGVCVDACPEEAARMQPAQNGEWFLSDTHNGPLVHAKLGVAQENSGKLVTLVRHQARATAMTRGHDLMLVDGSPGIGCPVIASVTGATMALVVTEPTLSGLHDLERIVELTRHFRIPTAVCINKSDINADLATRLAVRSKELGLPVLGRIRYDPAVTRAQMQKMSVVELDEGPAAEDIRKLWKRTQEALD